MSEAPAEEADRREPFSPLVAVSLGVLGVLAFAAFLVFGAFAPDRDGEGRGGSALSASAVGYAGLVELLRARGVPVAVSRGGGAADRDGLLVLTPPPGGAPIPRALLDDGDGPVLLVLPKWRTRPLPGHPGWVEGAGPLPPAEVERLPPAPVRLRRVEGPHGVLHGGTGLMAGAEALPVVPIAPLQAVDASADWTPVLLGAGREPVLLRRTGRQLYLLADPDVLSTRALASVDGARTALAVVDALRDGDGVTFDVTLNGFGTPPSLLRALFEPPLLGATLCGAAAGLLVLLMALHRFGPAAEPERADALGKRALADNAAGMIALARREPRMAEPYARLVRGQALRGLGAPPRLDAAGADVLLDAAARARGLPDTWAALRAGAEAARDRAGLVAAAARLHRWREALTRDDR